MAYGGVVVGGWQGGVETGQVVLLLASDVFFSADEGWDAGVGVFRVG